ncbi:MAG: radical SAM protein [Deltaproteobacteria bacterium]|nr:radical SAM protein [Deltaproteobacteria bacterium]
MISKELKTDKKHWNKALSTIRQRLVFPYRIVRNKALGKSEPISVVLVVNNRCNLDCHYCFGDYGNRRDKDYTTEELVKVIDDLYALGTRYMVVHGGETLLRKDVGYIVDYIKRKGIYVGFITNGILLAQNLDVVRNVDSLCISLDGNEAGNDLNRGTGSFKAAVDAIKLASKEKFRLRVSATLTRNTMHDIEFLAKLAKEHKFQLYFSILYKPLKKALDMGMSQEEIRESLSKILYFKNQGYPIFTSDRCLNYSMSWPFDYNVKHHATPQELPVGFEPIRCYYGRSKFVVEANGYVYPCFPLNEEFKALNLKEVGVAKAIEHVRKTNRCVACPHLSNNDYNLLLGLSARQLVYIVKRQLQEVFHI